MKLFLTTTSLIHTSLAQTQAPDLSPVEIISGQLDAFGFKKFEAAFMYASPRIKTRIKSPSRFKSMVESQFPMMIGISDVQYLEEVRGQGIVLQRVRIIDSEGEYFWFAYEMVRAEKSWRINGVTRLSSPDEMA